MKAVIAVTLMGLLVSACDGCKGTNCSWETGTSLGSSFVTERGVDRYYVRSARGIIDGFSASPNQEQYGPNDFQVEVEDIEEFAAIQEKPEWCWAAAISMTLNFQGIPGDQCDILRSLGESCNNVEEQFASRSRIIAALRGVQVNLYGRPALVQATSLATGNGTPLIDDLAKNWPPIVGLTAREGKVGHVYVLVGIRYSWVPGTLNQPVIWGVKLYDPWDGEYITMKGSEFERIFDFAVRVRVTHA